MLLVLTTMTAVSSRLPAQSSFVSGSDRYTLEIFDHNGRRFVNPPADITGSPFFTDEWLTGTIVTGSGEKIEHMHLRLNLQTQQVHFISGNNTELAAPSGYVKTLLLYDSSEGGRSDMEFRCRFPAVDSQDTLHFYQVLSKGKRWLLRSLSKSISQRKDELSGDVQREFIQYENYYLFDGNALHKVKRNRSSVLALLPDNKEKLQAFADSSKIGFGSWEDIRKVIGYYNTLR